LFLDLGEIRTNAQRSGVLSLKRNEYHAAEEETSMKFELWKLYTKLQNLMAREEGQDLIEYALVVALIAFAATAGMNTLASAINAAFGQIGTTLTTTIT
jgi:pilus assembly protein Flp/PilA